MSPQDEREIGITIKEALQSTVCLVRRRRRKTTLTEMSIKSPAYI
jgi:hypothetical protein